MDINYAGFLSKNAKALIYLAILTGLVLLFFSFRKKIKATAGDESRKALENLDVQKSGLGITENEAILKSENLLAAMNKYGTDEDAIIDNLAGLNKEDLLLIIKKFGVKPYNGFGLATRGYEKKFFAQDLNLIGWLRRELGRKNLKKVRSIFTDNGLSF